MENNEKTIQIAAAPIPQSNQIIRPQDITKIRITKWLTFEGKDWEDVFFSALIHLSYPLFATSVLTSTDGIARLLIIPYLIVVITIVSGSGWLIKQFPEMQALVWGRLIIIGIGIILGGLL